MRGEEDKRNEGKHTIVCEGKRRRDEEGKYGNVK